MKTYFGVDFGGTTAKLALVDERKRILRESFVDMARFLSPKAIAIEIGSIFKKMVQEKGLGTPPRRIGVGVAGDIDVERGVVRISPNLGWKNVPLRALLKKSTGVDVFVDN